MPYPVTIRMSSKLLDDFRECELGSFEDYENMTPEEQAEERYADEHVYVILGRHLTLSKAESRIEIRNVDEAAEVYYAACSGTFGLRDPDGPAVPPGLRAARRIADVLRPLIREDYPDLVRLWTRPDGY